MLLPMRTAPVLLALVLIPALAAGAAQDDLPQGEPAAPGERWRYDFTLYGWLVGAEGEARAGRVTVPIEFDFKDMLDYLDAGGMFMFQGSNGVQGFLVDVFFARLSRDLETALLNPRIKVRQTQADVMMTFGLGKKRWPELLVGARYTDVSTTVSTDRLQSKGTDRTLQPLVGLRFRGQISKRWRYSVRGDVGILGFDKNSSFNAVASVGYRFTNNWHADIGFRWLDQEISDPDLDLDLSMAGLGVGVGYTF